jgi:hypothetical protein
VQRIDDAGKQAAHEEEREQPEVFVTEHREKRTWDARQEVIKSGRADPRRTLCATAMGIGNISASDAPARAGRCTGVRVAVMRSR